LTEVIRYSNQTFQYTFAKELSDDVSCAVTGARGEATIWQASNFGSQGIGYSSLGAGGWHPDYDDGTNNQAFHFWSYVNSAAQGKLGGFIGLIGDTVHECWDFTDTTNPGRTFRDTKLAVAGIWLGTLIERGILSSSEVANWVDEWIGRRSFTELVRTYSLEPFIRNLDLRPCPLIKP
jgi:hypothetical protein